MGGNGAAEHDQGRAYALGLALLAAVAYASALRSGFASDDLSVIVRGRLIGSLANLPRLFLHDAMYNSAGEGYAGTVAIDTYRPLTMATFFIEHALWGGRAAGYHVVSVSLHVAAVLLAFGLGRRLGLGLGASFLGAALFAVHPSLAEAVHWVNGRSDPLCTLFFLAALAVWIDALRAPRGIALR